MMVQTVIKFDDPEDYEGCIRDCISKEIPIVSMSWVTTKNYDGGDAGYVLLMGDYTNEHFWGGEFIK